MKTYYLLSYQIPKDHRYKTVNLNNTNDITVELKVKVVWLWGLFSTTTTKEYLVPNHESLRDKFNIWNYMIENKIEF